MAASFDIRRLSRSELVRVADIDRTEHVEMLYLQDGEELIERHGRWVVPAWDAHGHGEHSIDAKVRELYGYLDRGGIALGALAGERMVGIGVVVPQVRPRLAQLAFLHVSAPWRGTGVGSSLSAQLEDIARAAEASDMVVSATPTMNTVAFYLGRGFVPMSHPLEELVELEPEDIHMHKAL